jgi:hypothetical protein
MEINKLKKKKKILDGLLPRTSEMRRMARLESEGPVHRFPGHQFLGLSLLHNLGPGLVDSL